MELERKTLRRNVLGSSFKEEKKLGDTQGTRSPQIRAYTPHSPFSTNFY
jgi:hypothetical protein